MDFIMAARRRTVLRALSRVMRSRCRLRTRVSSLSAISVPSSAVNIFGSGRIALEASCQEVAKMDNSPRLEAPT